MGIYGQDWASYQGSVPSTAGLSFVFVKVTEGEGYTNPAWLSQRADVKGAGLVFGAYHYPHMHDDAHAEADYFLSKITLQPGDLVVLDWEGYDAANSSVPKAQQLAYKESYLAYMKTRLPHNPVGLYCNTDYWRNVDTTGHRGDFLWIATAGLPAGQPGISAPWLFHQYGAAGVDRDFCNLPNLAALRTWALSFQATPPPAPTPAPTPAPSTLVEEDVLAYLPLIPANTNFDVPVEPAGTVAKPQGGARNGPMWLEGCAQGADGTVQVSLHTAKGWGAPVSHPVTVAGAKMGLALPEDGSVDKVRLHSTVPLLAYVVGRQVP